MLPPVSDSASRMACICTPTRQRMTRPSDEAQHVLRLLQGHTPQLPVYLDLEDSVISSNCSAADILRHTTIFCNTIQAAGYRAGVYANRNWWTTLLTDAAYDQWERWIAVWADQTNYNKPYQMWQYSSKGQISGISGNVDLDYWYGAPLTGTHRHTYQVTAQTAATCTQPGQTTYTCACGATKTETTAALGHNYGAWTTYTAPTCTVAGMERSVCTRCAAYQERTVAATGVHKWDAGVLGAGGDLHRGRMQTLYLHPVRHDEGRDPARPRTFL